MTATTTPLDWGQKIAYGSGDYGFNLYWQGLSLYLFYFYTDVLGLPNALAGLIYAIGSLWDAITDPAMGYFAERTRSRWGRYRPYLLFTPLPLGISYMALFWHPGEVSIITLAACALGAQFVFRLLFTIASTPYSSLMARMTQNSHDRTGMAGARMLFAYLGGFSVVLITGWLLENAASDRAAFFYLAMVSGVLASLVFWLCFALCKEPASDDTAGNTSPTLSQTLRSMRYNTPFLVVFVAILSATLGLTIVGKTVLYFFEYEMGDRTAGSQALLLIAATGLAIIPFWTWVTLKTSKRFVWMAGSAIATIGLLALLVNPASSMAMVMLNYWFISLGTGAYAVTFWGMLPDTVEYGEWQSGVRVESMIFGFVTFAQKAAVALSAIILGLLLDLIGYQAGAVQSEATLSGLRLIIVFVPLAGVIISVWVMAYYPLSPQRHAAIVAQIDAQKQ